MSKLNPVSYKELVEIFLVEGFRCVRTEGHHMVFTKPGIIRPVVSHQLIGGREGVCTVGLNYGHSIRFE